MSIQNWSLKKILVSYGIVLGALLIGVHVRMASPALKWEESKPVLPTVTSHAAIHLAEAPVEPRSKTAAIAGGNKGPAGEPSCNTQAVSGFEFEVCQYGGPAHQTAQQWLDSNGFAGTVKDNNTIVIDGVIDITHETSQAPNPKFRWI